MTLPKEINAVDLAKRLQAAYEMSGACCPPATASHVIKVLVPAILKIFKELLAADRRTRRDIQQ